MSSNPLSSYGLGSTDSWLYINIPTTSGAEFDLPSDWANTESVFELIIRSKSAAANIPLKYTIYNPAAAATTAKPVPADWGTSVTPTAGADALPGVVNAASKTTTAFTIFFLKNATSGKLSIAQNTNATAGNRQACDVWIRRAACVTTVA